MHYNVGRVATTYKGDFDSGATYNPLDFVSYNYSTYICIKQSTGNLPTNTTYWVPMALAGQTQPPTAEQIAAIEQTIYNSLVSQGVVIDSSYNAMKADVSTLKSNVSDISTVQSSLCRTVYGLEDTVSMMSETVGEQQREISHINDNQHLSDELYTEEEKNAVRAYINAKTDYDNAVNTLTGYVKTDNNFTDQDVSDLHRVKDWNGNNITNEELRTIHDFQQMNLRYVVVS